MRKLIIALLLCLIPTSVFAALDADTVWEVRGVTGSDNNGGGFVTGASGTDYTQQASAQLSLSDLASDGAGTGISSATGGFTAAMIGNLIQITGAGDGFTLGFYEVTAHTDTNNITIDRSAGISKTGGTGAIGGALATLNYHQASVVAGNTTYWKADGTYTLTGHLTFTIDGNTNQPIIWEGYTTTRGDNGKVTIAGASYELTFSGDSSQILRNVDITSTFNRTITTGDNGRFENCKIENTRGTPNGYCVTGGNTVIFIYCEFIGTATSGGILTVGDGIIYGCYFRDGVYGIVSTAPSWSVINSIFDSCTAAGIYTATASQRIDVINCVFYNCVRGIHINVASGFYNGLFLNNIFSDNSTSGAERLTNNVGTSIWDYNAWYNNGTDVTNITKGANSVSGTDPQFQDAANGDFSIGTNLKGLGFPGVMPGGLSTGYMDIGAIQREEAASSSETSYGFVN
jgi:hypothetical protein